MAEYGRFARAAKKEAAQAYSASRAEQADRLNQTIVGRDGDIDALLSTALAGNPRLRMADLKKAFFPTAFQEPQARSQPKWENFQPKPAGVLSRIMPGSARRQARLIAEAEERFDNEQSAYDRHRDARDSAFRQHRANEEAREAAISSHNSRRRKA